MSETVMVRLPNWLGDTVMAVPLLRALRTAWPDARIVAVGPWVEVLRGQGLADVLAPYPRRWGLRLRVADRVGAFRPTLALLLPNSLEAALAAWYWGARRRVGFAGDGRSWLLTDRVALPSPRPHQVDEYLLLLRPLGVIAGECEPKLAPPPSDSPLRVQARRLLEEAGAAEGTRRVGIHLGAEWGPAKLWPTEHVAELCARLLGREIHPVLLGTGRDRGRAEEVTRRVPAVSLVGRDSPALLPAVLAELDALVCGDTGVGHLAAALGTPVVALFGPTDPRRTAPRGRVEVRAHPTPCAPCFYRVCPIDQPCLRFVGPGEVVGALAALIPWD
jgi:heptosyltransferase-2